MALVTTLVAAAIAAIVLDQASKWWVMSRRYDPSLQKAVGSIGLRPTLNPGSGFFRLSRRAALLAWLGCVAVLGLILAFAPPLPPTGAFGVGLAVGGATGNLCDRVVRGAVVDFIAIRGWRTSNLADIALVGGAVLAVWSLV